MVAGHDAGNLMSRFWARVEESPENVFAWLVSAKSETPITQSEMGRLASAFASTILSKPSAPGLQAFIFLHHRKELYGAFLGAMTAGAVPSIMPCRTTKQDSGLYWNAHQTLLDRSPGAIVITDANLEDMVDGGLDLSRHVVIDVDAMPGTDTPAAIRDAAGQTALIQHSSGTTGLKKAVLLPHGKIDRQLTEYSRRLNVKSDDVVVSWLPLYHDMGLIACFLLPIFNGIPFVHMDAFDWLARPRRLLKLAERFRGTLIWLPNFAFDHLVNVTPRGPRSETYDLGSVRMIINSSETCRHRTMERFEARFAEMGLRRDAIQTCYAMAETVYAVSQTTRGALEDHLTIDRGALNVGDRIVPVDGSSPVATTVSSCGSLIDGVRCRIVGAEGDDLPDDSIGSIWLSGDFVVVGYHKNEALSAERFVDGWYDTKDIGFVRAGNLYVLGRIDDVIICNGKNVMAHELEELLSAVDGVKRGRLIVVPRYDDAAGSQKLVVLAERPEDEAQDGDDVSKRLASLVFTHTGVATHSVRFVPAGWIVKTTSGKLNRSENANKYAREFQVV